MPVFAKRLPNVSVTDSVRVMEQANVFHDSLLLVCDAEDGCVVGVVRLKFCGAAIISAALCE